MREFRQERQPNNSKHIATTCKTMQQLKWQRNKFKDNATTKNTTGHYKKTTQQPKETTQQERRQHLQWQHNKLKGNTTTKKKIFSYKTTQQPKEIATTKG